MRLTHKILYSITQYPKGMDLSYPSTFYVKENYYHQYKDLIKNISENRPKPTFDAKSLAFGSIPADYMVNIMW